MQDLTGVPAVVDLAAMRDAIIALGSDAKKINPLVPVELVIDHSVIVERNGTASSYDENVEIEYQRNEERYIFLKWAQSSFEQFRVVPPGMGICHQVNLENLAKVVFDLEGVAYFDTLVGTDSHTTMVNGLGVLGWGRRRHRSGSKHAGSTRVDAHTSGRWTAHRRRDPRGRDRNRRCSHDHPTASSPRRRGQVRRGLRPRGEGALG